VGRKDFSALPKGNTMYLPYFITYILAGLAISLVAFFWALRNGQFQEQQRARYLPLEAEMPLAPVRATRWKRIEIYTLFFLAGAGLLTSGVVLVFALMSGK
jgi:cbb3-type cytochrome oxidase maturation protein